MFCPFIGLFHGAMALSGNALCDQCLQSHPMDSAKELAKRLECSASEKGSDIVECLRRKPQQELIAKANEMTVFFSFPRWFAPTVDGLVLPDRPEELLAQGR